MSATTWPAHADGSPKKFGELTTEEKRAESARLLEGVVRELGGGNGTVICTQRGAVAIFRMQPAQAGGDRHA